MRAARIHEMDQLLGQVLRRVGRGHHVEVRVLEQETDRLTPPRVGAVRHDELQLGVEEADLVQVERTLGLRRHRRAGGAGIDRDRQGGPHCLWGGRGVEPFVLRAVEVVAGAADQERGPRLRGPGGRIEPAVDGLRPLGSARHARTVAQGGTEAPAPGPPPVLPAVDRKRTAVLGGASGHPPFFLDGGRTMRITRCTLLGLTLLLVACGEGGVDWNAPENLALREKSAKVAEGVQLEYWSLVDAGCQPVYDALVDIEHYPDFIPGVDRANLLNVTPTSKTAQIAQRVIGRQSNAKVEWTFHPEKHEIDFKTLSSDLNFNDGHYELEPSPDGKRCLVRSSYLVKEGQGMAQSVPIGVLAAGTKEAFLAAAQGVKKRAAGGTPG